MIKRNCFRAFEGAVRLQQVRSASRRISPTYSRFTTNASKVGLFSGLALGLSSYYFIGKAVELDNSTEPLNSVSVDSSVNPFPINLSTSTQKNLDSNFSLLGYGVRTVTFLKFKVYGIGLYICDKDINRAKQILKQELVNSGPDGQLQEVLNDPVKSSEIVEKLLDNGIKFVARISPVRNTDYSHLKDGLIKSILAHPKSKENREVITLGLEQLRSVFSERRGSVPKNNLLYLEIVNGGQLSVSFAKPNDTTSISLGLIKEPLVSKVLFLSYLSGPKPLSDALKKSCAEGFARL